MPRKVVKNVFQSKTIISGLTLERAILISFPMKATSMGFGKQKSGFTFVGILIFSVLAVHVPTLFFLEYDEVKVITRATSSFFSHN